MSAGSSFYDYQGPRQRVKIADRVGWLPVWYHDNRVFTSLHTADLDQVTSLLPSRVIEPVRWLDGRALVQVSVLRYTQVSWIEEDGEAGGLAPYGEVSILAVVSEGPSRPVLPLLGSPGGFVLHLPVTSWEAREPGRVVYGFPKFLADMDFAESDTRRSIRLSEGGSDILELTVRAGGLTRPDNQGAALYTSLDGQLRETVLRQTGHAQVRLGKNGGRLELGDHTVAQQLRLLDVSPNPVMVSTYLDHTLMLPGPGRSLGPAEEYKPYPGTDDEYARFTLTHPHAATTDLYEALNGPE